jgi:hypothetical protein
LGLASPSLSGIFVCLYVLASLSILNQQIVHQDMRLLLDGDFLLNLLAFLTTGPVVTEIPLLSDFISILYCFPPG